MLKIFLCFPQWSLLFVALTKKAAAHQDKTGLVVQMVTMSRC